MTANQGQTKQCSLEDIGVLFGDPPHIARIDEKDLREHIDAEGVEHETQVKF
jgi:hypothetical protein